MMYGNGSVFTDLLRDIEFNICPLMSLPPGKPPIYNNKHSSNLFVSCSHIGFYEIDLIGILKNIDKFQQSLIEILDKHKFCFIQNTSHGSVHLPFIRCRFICRATEISQQTQQVVFQL